MSDERIENERNFGRHLASQEASEIWGWQSPAGKVRAEERFKFLKSNINPHCGQQVLELGCGTGVFSKKLSPCEFNLFSMDISAELLQEAKKQLVDAGGDQATNFIVGNAMDTSFKAESFDAIVGVSVLHHLDIDKALSEIHRLLIPGGRIAFCEPNLLNPQVAFERLHPITRELTHTTPDETAFFENQLNQTLNEHGFASTEVEPFDFLHPATPRNLVTLMHSLSRVLSDVPIINNIAGSLKIKAVKSA